MTLSEELTRKFTSIRAAVLGYLRVLVRDPHLAEDLFQDTCVVVLQKADTYDPSKPFEAWVYGIARNLARHALRKQQPVAMSSPELAEAVDRACTEAPAEETEHMARQLEHLNHCLEKVEETKREMIQKRYRLGATFKEIGEQTGRTAGAVQVELSRLRQFLLRCVQRQLSEGGIHHG